MNKRGKNKELKIYELLGVKTFRKLVFGFCNLLMFKKTKEEREEILNSVSNYKMKKGNGLQDLRDFKKQLLFNTKFHIGALLVCVPTFLKIADGTATLPAIIINLSCAAINIYSIMLQRYNYIRINEVLKRGRPREEKQRNELKEELRKKDLLLHQHTYKVVDKHDKEKEITLDELLENATLEQLKQCREYLELFTRCNKRSYLEDEFYKDSKVPLGKKKTLKIELK